jgi:hypothetical protein
MPRLVIAAVIPLLKLATPALFLGGLVGLHSWLGSRFGGGSRLERAGVVLGLLGSVVGLLGSVVDEERGMGLWATLPHLGALVLGSGTLGWVSLLTDPGYSGVLVSMRLLHVACAVLFCLSCVVWGVVLFSEAS